MDRHRHGEVGLTVVAAANPIDQDAPPVVALLTAVVVVGAAGGSLHVEKKGDAKLPCAANAALEQAIKVRLPGVRLARGKPAGPDLTAEISATSGGFRFEVRRADGSVAMSRDLFSGCAQLGDTGALILERYLQQIRWEGREAGLVAPSPPPPPQPRPPSPLVGERAGVRGPVSDAGEQSDAGSPDSVDLISRIGVTPSPPQEEPPLTPALSPTRGEGVADAGAPPVINLPPPSRLDPIVTAVEVSAGGGLWYGNGLVGGYSLDVGVLVRDRVRLGVLAVANTPLSRRAPPSGTQRGTLQTFDLGTFVMLGVCTRTALTFCGNAFGGARITWAAVSTNLMSPARLFRTSTGALVVPELGALARLSYVAFGHLLLALDVMLGIPLGKGAFVIEGLTEDPLYTSPVDAAVLLRAGVRF